MPQHCLVVYLSAAPVSGARYRTLSQGNDLMVLAQLLQVYSRCGVPEQHGQHGRGHVPVCGGGGQAGGEASAQLARSHKPALCSRFGCCFQLGQGVLPRVLLWKYTAHLFT
jgi:hypothetical protein